MPTEAKSQYFKLTAAARDNPFNFSKSDFELLKRFLANHRIDAPRNGEYYAMLLLNVALVNHSCVPNAEVSRIGLCHELRAIKDISKGEEITTCYYDDVKKYGSILRKRKIALKKDLGFDCKCPLCLGQVPFQEKTMKKLIKLEKREPGRTWKKEALIADENVGLRMELRIGSLNQKVLNALAPLAITAHCARDKKLLEKTMNKWKQLAEETKLDYLQRLYDSFETGFSQWSNAFTSGNAPEKEECDFLYSRLLDPVIADVD